VPVIRRVVLVGNAPLCRSIAGLVDTADHVVRFNKVRGHGGTSGSRTDELYLINHGGQMAEWLATDELAEHRALRTATTVVLPVPMLPGHLSPRRARALERATGIETAPDRINHLDEARARFARSGHAIVAVGVAEYRGAQRALYELLPAADERYPSTGFIAVHRTLARARPDERIELVGFAFEGWRGHSWNAERRWVTAREREGRLAIRAVD